MTRIARRLIDVTGMRDVVQRRIPVISLDSGKPGPVIWLAGCIHGDEPGGAVIIQEVFGAIRKRGLERGQLNGLPLVNSHGFENVSRFINSDREDLNRCFPGDAGGTSGQRMARRLFDLIADSDPDLVIDLHNDWIQSVPYLVLEAPSEFRDEAVRSRTIALAAATGLLRVQETEESPPVTGSLTGSFVAAGVPAFTIEAGGACGIVESSVAAGVASVLGVLAALGLTPSTPAATASADAVLDYYNLKCRDSSGILRFGVAPGDAVRAGQALGRVVSAFGSTEETLRARRAGYVLGVSDHARATPGSEVIAIAEITASR